MTGRRKEWLLVVALLVARGSVAQKPARAVAKTTHRPNLLLITVDTLRADHVGVYGAKQAQTPTIDALGHDGVVFEHAYSQVPLTLASHTSLLTGTYPFHNGVQDFTGQPLRPGIRSIAESLKANGYDTGAVVSSYVLDRSWGLNRGFNFYYDAFKGSSFLENDPGLVERKAGASVDEALRWLRRRGTRPFFLWLHLYDPHSGYDPPEPFRARFSASPYDGEIAYADHELSRLIAYLKQHGLYDRMAIIFASDHGESLGDHGEREHGFFVYHSTLQVPLIIKPPQPTRITSHRVASPVPIMGIAPTLLNLGKIEDKIQKQFETVALLPEPTGPEANEVYSESFYSFSSFGWAPLRTINTSTYQYIEAPKPELYDLRADPAETKNMIADQPAVSSVLSEKLKQRVSQYAPPADSGDAAKSGLTAEAAEKLRSLGYMAYRSPVSNDALAKGLPDPKDKLWDFNTILEALDAGKLGKLDEQRALLRRVEQRNPSMYLVAFLLGEADLKSADWKGAEESLRRCLELNPNFDQAMTALARAFHEQGDNEHAGQWLEKALQVNPQNVKAWYEKGWINMQTDQGAAITAFEKTLSIQPDFALAHRDLGMVQFQQKNYAVAAKHLARAVDLGIDDPAIYNFLGISYSRTNRVREAVESYQQALKRDPDRAEAHLNLAYAYQRLNRPSEAKTEYAQACRLESKFCQYVPADR